MTEEVRRRSEVKEYDLIGDERDDAAGWKQFVPFASLPNIDWNSPNLRFVDLTGDGHADIDLELGDLRAA